MTTIKHIRVTYEGPAERYDWGWGLNGGDTLFAADGLEGLTVEVLPDPIKFQDGDVLKGGFTWVRREGMWYTIDAQTQWGPIEDKGWPPDLKKGSVHWVLPPEGRRE